MYYLEFDSLCHRRETVSVGKGLNNFDSGQNFERSFFRDTLFSYRKT